MTDCLEVNYLFVQILMTSYVCVGVYIYIYIYLGCTTKLEDIHLTENVNDLPSILNPSLTKGAILGDSKA